MSKVIHFYATHIPASNQVYGNNFAFMYRDAEKLLHAHKSFHTTQMSFLGDPRVCDYDALIVHDSGRTFAIENNHDGTWSCDRTDRELRHGHQLFNLWRGGEFDAN